MLGTRGETHLLSAWPGRPDAVVTVTLLDDAPRLSRSPVKSRVESGHL